MSIKNQLWFLRVLTTLIATLTLTFTLGAAEPEPAQSEPPPEPAVTASESQSAYSASIARIDPMDTTGLAPDLVTVLSSYYRKNFISQEHWDQIESVRFDGVLELPEGDVAFTAFKKKPDYCKVVVFAPNGGRIVMAYDGADAWQLNTLQPGAEATDMPPMDALNFIRDATTGGHLLYPRVVGKEIELVGTVNFDGKRHYEVLVTLPYGQALRSLLDMTTFYEVRQTTINNVTGDREVSSNSDFRDVEGIRIPFASVLTANGREIHRSRIERVQTNLGVMPWMFSRSSGASLPGGALPSLSGVDALPREPVTRAQPEGSGDGLSFGRDALDSWSTESVFDIDPAALTDQEAAEILLEIDSEEN